MTSQPSDSLSILDSEQFQTEATLNSHIISAAIPATTPTVSSSARTRKRQRSSKIWEYTSGSSTDTFRNDAGKAVWRCKFCWKEYLELSGTKVAVTHLATYGINVNSGQELRTISRQASISDAFQHIDIVSDYKRRNLLLMSMSTIDGSSVIDGLLLEVLYIRWITACSIPFRMVEVEEFRVLLLI